MRMAQTIGAWTLAEFDRLPDDGNTYELVDGELFVTPAPSPAHESLAVTLRLLIEPYVIEHALGRVFTPRAALRAFDSEVEPDLMVRARTATVPQRWEDAPLPFLVVEVLSNTTRQRDHVQKRRFFMRCGVAQYWIVDGSERTIRVVSPSSEDVVVTRELVWQPSGATEALTIDLARYFEDALGDLIQQPNSR